MFAFYYLPEGVDEKLKSLMAEISPSNYGLNKFNLDHPRFLLSLIHIVPKSDRQIFDRLEDLEKYVPLASELMQRAVRKYRDYWNILREAGIVEINESYQVSTETTAGKCKGYRFTEEYRGKKVITGLFKKPFQFIDLEKVKVKAESDYPWLTKWLNPESGLDIHYAKACDFINSKYAALKLDPSLRDQHKKDPSKTKDYEDQYRFASLSIEEIRNKDFRYRVDESGNRFHSNFTNFSSTLRNFITYKGERLVSIDIRNSQPYFSALLLELAFYKEGELENLINWRQLNSKAQEGLHSKLVHVRNLVKGFFEKNDSRESLKLYKDLISQKGYSYKSYNLENVLVKNINKGFSIYNKTLYYDIKRNKSFKSNKKYRFSSLMLCKNVMVANRESNKYYLKDFKLDTNFLNLLNINSKRYDIYEYMLEVSKQKDSSDTGLGFSTRQQIKEVMFQVFFSKNKGNDPNTIKHKAYFRKLFPEVYQLFYCIKKGDHALLACLLQNIESYAILKVITPRLGKEFPDMPIITIHDSIAVPEKYQYQVKAIMEEELTRLVGMQPGLKMETWDPNNVAEDLARYKTVIEKDINEKKAGGLFIQSLRPAITVKKSRKKVG